MGKCCRIKTWDEEYAGSCESAGLQVSVQELGSCPHSSLWPCQNVVGFFWVPATSVPSSLLSAAYQLLIHVFYFLTSEGGGKGRVVLCKGGWGRGDKQPHPSDAPVIPNGGRDHFCYGSVVQQGFTMGLGYCLIMLTHDTHPAVGAWVEDFPSLSVPSFFSWSFWRSNLRMLSHTLSNIKPHK